MFVARRSDDAPDYAQDLPLSYRMCNTLGDRERISVYVGKKNDLGPTNYHLVPFGQCIEIGAARQVSFHTPASTSATVRGQFEAFAPGAFSGVRVVRKPTKVSSSFATPIAPFRKATVTCLERTDPGSPPIAKSYWASCALTDLSGGRNFRICFDDNYSNQPVGENQYPGSRLPIVLDPALMTIARQDNPDLWLYNSTASKGCRDLFKVDKAYVLVTENLLGYRPMKTITYRFAELRP